MAFACCPNDSGHCRIALFMNANDNKLENIEPASGYSSTNSPEIDGRDVYRQTSTDLKFGIVTFRQPWYFSTKAVAVPTGTIPRMSILIQRGLKILRPFESQTLKQYGQVSTQYGAVQALKNSSVQNEFALKNNDS